MARCVSLRARVVNRDASYPMSVPSITCLCAMPLNPPPLSWRSRYWADPLVTWWTCCVALATVRCLVLPGARLAFALLPPGRPLFGSPAQHPFQVRCISTTADIAVGLHLTPNARATGGASPSFSLLWVHVWVDYALDCSIACRAARAVVQGCSDLRRPTCKAGTLPVCLTLSDRRAFSCTRAAALLLVSLWYQGESYFGELTYSGVTAIMGPYATAAEAAGTSIVIHPHGAAACRRGALLASS
jgi:hypothetical protein